jgi:SAM-dependent methyltransferase
MDLSVYEIEDEVEAAHWWFAGRRRLLARELALAGAATSWRILDLGSGTGGNLRLLRDLTFPYRFGTDVSLVAAASCVRKNLAPMLLADATNLPFADGTFDLVMAMDVLEHIERDDLAAAEIRRILRPNGIAIITVPAFAALWGPQDVLSHHLRRYRMRSLMKLLKAAGFTSLRRYYFNFILFLPILAARRLLSASKVELRSENELNSPMLNAILRRLFNIDINSAPYLRPPFGVSICAVLRADPAAADSR